MSENSQVLKQEFDEVAENYDDFLASLGMGSDTDKYAEYKVKLLSELIKSPVSSILDFGCGTGRLLKFVDKYFHIEKNAIKLFGCDISEDSLLVAQKNVPEATFFVDDDFDEFGKMSNTYDVIIVSCVFHHMPKEERPKWTRQL